MNPPLRLLGDFQGERGKSPDWLVQLEERRMWVAADVVGHNYTFILPDMNGRITFDRRSAKLKRTTRNRPIPSWAFYLSGVTCELARTDLELDGAVVVIAGDEPPGPRYEHALGMAFAALWYDVNQHPYTTADLISLMENIQKDYLPD